MGDLVIHIYTASSFALLNKKMAWSHHVLNMGFSWVNDLYLNWYPSIKDCCHLAPNLTTIWQLPIHVWTSLLLKPSTPSTFCTKDQDISFLYYISWLIIPSMPKLLCVLLLDPVDQNRSVCSFIVYHTYPSSRSAIVLVNTHLSFLFRINLIHICRVSLTQSLTTTTAANTHITQAPTSTFSQS